MKDFEIKQAKKEDVPIILSFIKKLAEYEKLSYQVTATEKDLEQTLFTTNANAETVIGYYKNEPVVFALYFYNYSTFLAKKGLYLEDLFVLPEHRGKGFGKSMLVYLAKLAVKRNCSRFEWSVLDWNEPAIKFYESIGAKLKKEWVLNRLENDDLIKFSKQ